MEKVKTFTIGTASGIGSSFDKLDTNVSDLGDIEIIEIVDTLIPKEYTQYGDNAGERIARRVIYKVKS